MPTNFSRTPAQGSPIEARSYIKRAALFAGGLVLLYLALQLMPTTAGTADLLTDEAGTVARSATQSSDPGVRPGMILAALILIGGSVFAYVLRRKTTRIASDGVLTTLADMPITQDQRLRLVRVQDEVLLLGITSGQISVLKTFSADEFVRTGQENGVSAEAPAFADMLREAAQRYRNLPRN